MNDNNGGLYFIVGALVVVVGIGMYLYTGSHSGGGSSGPTTKIEKSITVEPDGGVTKSITRERTP